MYTAIEVEILEDYTGDVIGQPTWEHLDACALHQALKTAPTPVTYEAKAQNGRPFGNAKRKTSYMYNSG